MTHQRTSRSGRRHTLAAIAVVATLAIAGCSADDPADKPSDAAPDLSITIASAAATPIFGQLYIAEQLGYFEDAGVNVKILDNAGSNVANLVVSEQADLGMIAISAPLMVAMQGKSTTVVYSTQAGASAGMLVGAKDVDSIEDLKGKRIGTLAKGSSTYGLGAVYNDEYELSAELVPMQNNAALASALKSGQISAATGPYDSYAPLIVEGEANILIDTRDKAQREEILGPDTPEGAVWGLTAIIDEKREAVVAVLAAFDRALTFMREQSPEEVAKVLSEHPSFQATPLDLLTVNVESAMNYVGINDGFIPSDIWSVSLDAYATWGLSDFDPTDATFAYGDRVDMSMLQEAVNG